MLQFIEGHTLLTPTTEVDTWYEGRTIDNWADPKVSEKIPQLFPIHEQKEIARSLSVSLRTLNNVSVQIAQELHYAFPTEGQSSFLAWLHELIQKSSPIE